MIKKKEFYTQFGIICGILLVFAALLRSSNVYHVLNEIHIETYNYPENADFHVVTTDSVISSISKERIGKRLEGLSRIFHDGRFYNSEKGYKSSLYLYEKLQKVALADYERLSVELFNHSSWKQPSVIFRIQGKSDNLVIVGCHVDSINLNPLKEAPGVDDNLSGVDILLETIDVLIESNVNFSDWQNTVEFHFYAAEEMSSLGSRDVFGAYKKHGKRVAAMLQQDMTGFTKKTFENGMPEHFGLVVDYSSKQLMQFVRRIISEYTDIKSIDTKCNKVCSDQISPLIFGYPGAYVLESVIENSNPYIHTDQDLIDHIDVNHMVQHAKLVTAFVSELSVWIPKYLNESMQSDQDLFRFSLYDFFILFATSSTRRTIWCVILVAVAISMSVTLIGDIFSGENSETVDPDEVIPLRVSQNDNSNRKIK